MGTAGLLLPHPRGLTRSPSFISEFADCWENFADNRGNPFQSWEKLTEYSKGIKRRLQKILEVRSCPCCGPLASLSQTPPSQPQPPFPVTALLALSRLPPLLSLFPPCPFSLSGRGHPVPSFSPFLRLSSAFCISQGLLGPVLFSSQVFSVTSPSLPPARFPANQPVDAS